MLIPQELQLSRNNTLAFNVGKSHVYPLRLKKPRACEN